MRGGIPRPGMNWVIYVRVSANHIDVVPGPHLDTKHVASVETMFLVYSNLNHK